MKKIPAAMVDLPADSPLWDLMAGLDNGSVFCEDGKDTVVLDVEWLLKSKEDHAPDTSEIGRKWRRSFDVICNTLDREPECRGWRKFHLLYFWPR